MQAFSFSFYLFHFTVYCCLPVAVDILSFFPSYPLYRHPTSNWLPLTLLSLCLTAVRLLWEVIRKSSTETHTAAAENKAFNRFYSLSALQQQKAGSQGKRMMREGAQALPGHLQGTMSGRKCCFGNPKFLCAEEPGIFLITCTCACVIRRQKVLSIPVQHTGSFEVKMTQKLRVYKRRHISVIQDRHEVAFLP